MAEELQLRIYGDAALPTLIYLPGLHGDWTLIGAFRKAVTAKVRFVEVTYPRTLVWSLDDYAVAIETALAQNGITRGWLLGESFGSQVLWEIVARNNFHAQSVILAGGFVKHPMRWAVRATEKFCGNISLALLTRIIFGYAKIAYFRHRHSPETLADIDEFVQRRTEFDLQAATHRLHLIAQSDPRKIAAQAAVPVFALTGIVDPIVPWPFVRRWLKKNCPALHDYKIIKRANHNILATAPNKAARQALEWML
jgi:pimeloyl-ACP methyl ester carboxylesterase